MPSSAALIRPLAKPLVLQSFQVIGAQNMLRRVLTTARRHAASFHSSTISASSKKSNQALVARAVADLPTDTDGSVLTDKAKALESVIKEVNKRFGKGSLMKMSGEPMKVETIPSGALTLDIALGGGFPKGRIVEIYGPESSGKTTLALHAIAEVQRQGGTAALIDAEHAFDPIYSKRAGVDVDGLLLCQPDSGEMALEVVDQLIRSSSVDIIVVDSVAALVPQAELEGEVGQVLMGAQARMMSGVMRKITGNASKCNTTIIFINQLRQKIGVIYGNPEVTTGGQALKFYASVRVDVRRKQTIEGNRGEQIGIRVKAKVVKNKCAAPYKVSEFDILFGSGISTLGCLLDAAEKVEVVRRSGSWYYIGDRRLAQGREKTLVVLGEDPALKREVEELTRQKLSGEVDINELYEPEPADGEHSAEDLADLPENREAAVA